jgi:phage-related protein
MSEVDAPQPDLPIQKPVVWLGTSLEDLREFPEEAQDTVGYALYLAQIGLKHPKSKPLQGFGGASVLEVVVSAEGDAFRAMYTVRFSDVIYALHCFQKKSTSGIKTSKTDIAMIHKRLLEAKLDHENRNAK